MSYLCRINQAKPFLPLRQLGTVMAARKQMSVHVIFFFFLFFSHSLFFSSLSSFSLPSLLLFFLSPTKRKNAAARDRPVYFASITGLPSSSRFIFTVRILHRLGDAGHRLAPALIRECECSRGFRHRRHRSEIPIAFHSWDPPVSTRAMCARQSAAMAASVGRMHSWAVQWRCIYRRAGKREAQPSLDRCRPISAREARTRAGQ